MSRKIPRPDLDLVTNVVSNIDLNLHTVHAMERFGEKALPKGIAISIFLDNKEIFIFEHGETKLSANALLKTRYLGKKLGTGKYFRSLGNIVPDGEHAQKIGPAAAISTSNFVVSVCGLNTSKRNEFLAWKIVNHVETVLNLYGFSFLDRAFYGAKKSNHDIAVEYGRLKDQQL